MRFDKQGLWSALPQLEFGKLRQTIRGRVEAWTRPGALRQLLAGQDRLLRIAPWWIVALLVGSLMPLDAKQAIGTVGGLHRGYHFLSFGSTALLLQLTQPTRRGRMAVCALVIALGASLEILQHVIYGNVLEWWDIRDDAFGVIAAYLGRGVSLRGLKVGTSRIAEKGGSVLGVVTPQVACESVAAQG